MSDEKPDKTLSENSWALIEDQIIDGRLDPAHDDGPDLGRAVRVAGRRRLPGKVLPEPFLDAYYREGVPVRMYRHGGELVPHPFIKGLEVSKEGDVHYHRRELRPREIFLEDSTAGRQPLEIVLIDRPDIMVFDEQGRPMEGRATMRAVPVRLLVIETFRTFTSEELQGSACPSRRRHAAWNLLAHEVVGEPDTR